MRVYRLTRSADPRAVIQFYRGRMSAWHVEDLSATPSISLSRGDAYVYVQAGAGELVLEVDHDCFKGGDHPRCFGP